MLCQRFLQAMPYLVPRALVLRFFLAPDYFCGIWKAGNNGRKFGNRKWIELLDSNERGIGYVMHLAPFGQVEIDLAAADNQAACLLWLYRLNFRNDQLESTARKFGNG